LPYVENLQYEEEEAVGGARRLPTCATRSKEEVAGGARRLPTCGYEEQGRGR